MNTVKPAAELLGQLAEAELNGGVAVLFHGAVSDDLTAVELEHRDRHVLARVREDAGHAHLLCDNA